MGQKWLDIDLVEFNNFLNFVVFEVGILYVSVVYFLWDIYKYIINVETYLVSHLLIWKEVRWIKGLDFSEFSLKYGQAKSFGLGFKGM